MLSLIGRKADGWLPSAWWASKEYLVESLRLIAEASAGAGRDPADIRCMLNIGGSIEAEQSEPFVGPVSYWIEELSGLAEVGVDAFVFWPKEDAEQQVKTFALEIAPAVRSAAGG
jgi:alkanesulfonate monooxygenase SsuD/methylene tetrahydromethanopterin reductase-like flavin-dependent oxidoreductase (luciferase family)